MFYQFEEEKKWRIKVLTQVWQHYSAYIEENSQLLNLTVDNELKRSTTATTTPHGPLNSSDQPQHQLRPTAHFISTMLPTQGINLK